MAIFERWLDEGRSWHSQAQKRFGFFPKRKPTEEKLLEKLRSAAPPDGVKIVGALAALSHVSEMARRKVETHPHWMVRFAGYLTDFCTPRDRAALDGNYWVKQLAVKPNSDFANLITENEKDGTLLLLIPEGAYLRAGGDFVPMSFLLHQYRLALHPVTNRQFQRFLFAMKQDRYDWGRPEELDHPAVNIGWSNAKAYCKWAGLQLPSEHQWEKGARWSDGRVYSWGNEWNPDLCRSGTSLDNLGSPAGDLLGGFAKVVEEFPVRLAAGLGDPGAAARVEGIDLGSADVWSYPNGCSPWGLYQMTGNVWEWCEDGEGGYRAAKGGSWYDSEPALFRSDNRLMLDAGARQPYCGFRCALKIAY